MDEIQPQINQIRSTIPNPKVTFSKQNSKASKSLNLPVFRSNAISKKLKTLQTNISF